MSNLFAPPKEEELKSIEGSGDVFSPPNDDEVAQLSMDDIVSHETLLDPGNNVQGDDKQIISTLNSNLFPPKSGDPDFWSKMSDYVQTFSNGAMEGATGNKAAELSSFVTNMMTNQNRDNTKDVQSVIDESHERNPWTFRSGQLFGTVAGAPVWGAGKLGMAAYGAASGAEGDSIGEKALGAGLGGATGLGLAYAAPAIASAAAPYVAKAAGYLGQIPEKAQELIFEPFGAAGKYLPVIGSMLNKSKNNSPASSLFSDSAKVKALKKIEDVASLSKLGGNAANAVKSTEQEIVQKLSDDKSVGGKLTSSISELLGNETLNRSYASLSDAEKSVVMAAMARGFQQRGLNPDPVVLKNVFEDMASGTGMDLEKSSIKDVVRTINRRDPAWAAAAFKNVSDFFNPLLEKTGNIAPEYYEAQLANEQLNKMVRSGAVNRMMQRDGPQGKYQFTNKAMSPYFEDAENLYPSTGTIGAVEEPTKAAIPSAIQKQNAIKESSEILSKKPWLGDLSEDVIKKYTGVNVSSQSDLQQAGAIAAQRLGNINAGKSLANMASGLTGLSSWAQSRHSPAAIIAGMTPQAISWAGKAGQAMESWGDKAIVNPSIVANSMISNPSVVKMLAKAPGKIGQIGQQLDIAFQQNGLEGLKAKAFVLMSTGQFREAIIEYVNGPQMPEAMQPEIVETNLQ